MPEPAAGPNLTPSLMSLPPSESTSVPGELLDAAAHDERTVVPLAIEDWLTVIVMGRWP